MTNETKKAIGILINNNIPFIISYVSKFDIIIAMDKKWEMHFCCDKSYAAINLPYGAFITDSHALYFSSEKALENIPKLIERYC